MLRGLFHTPRRCLATMADFYAECQAAGGALKFYRNGEWAESASGKTVSVLNPCTNAPAFQVQGGAQEPERCRVVGRPGMRHAHQMRAAGAAIARAKAANGRDHTQGR